uniref:RFX-type winged-helix domain-containing protein n=1 Tax=Steinernema glaseri TaxID=37863 RepID=A0A1I7YSA6_9BILA
MNMSAILGATSSDSAAAAAAKLDIVDKLQRMLEGIRGINAARPSSSAPAASSHGTSSKADVPSSPPAPESLDAAVLRRRAALARDAARNLESCISRLPLTSTASTISTVTSTVAKTRGRNQLTATSASSSATPRDASTPSTSSPTEIAASLALLQAIANASKVRDGTVGSSLELPASCLDLTSATDNSAVSSANQLALIGAAAAGAQTRTLTPHLNPMDPYPLTSHIHSPTATYVYATDGSSYPAYYQYQPTLSSPGTAPNYALTQHQPQQNSPASGDDDGSGSNQINHASRAPSVTFQWLNENYETADGTSLPRCTLYNHYRKHCQEQNIDPVNAASFGKLIRSVFIGLRTRRLGTRGHSKYHYYGIRIKADSPLLRETNSNGSGSGNESGGSNTTPMHEYATRNNARRSSQARNSFSREFRASQNQDRLRQDSSSPSTNGDLYTASSNALQPSSEISIKRNAPVFDIYDHDAEIAVCPEKRAKVETQQMVGPVTLGDGGVPSVEFENLEGMEEFLRPLALNMQHVVKFTSMYSAHCAEILQYIKALNFDAVNEAWISFWSQDHEESNEERTDENTPVKPEESNPDPVKLSQVQMYRLCTVPEILNYVEKMDLAFYQVIVEVLMPDVLSEDTSISELLANQVRNFSKSMETGLRKALSCVPAPLEKRKMKAIRMLAQTLRRYTSLNHLAQAARAVFQNPQQMDLMYEDFVRVDMQTVSEQAAFVCECDPVLVNNLTADFRENLQKLRSLEEWTEWMEAVIDQVLAKYYNCHLTTMANAGRKFLTRWSYYGSMIIRDLTLRSANSFGSFHLIRLLFDEYMLYLVEKSLAKSANKPLISILYETRQEEFDYTPTPRSNGIAMVSEASVPYQHPNIVTVSQPHPIQPHPIYQTQYIMTERDLEDYHRQAAATHQMSADGKQLHIPAVSIVYVDDAHQYTTLTTATSACSDQVVVVDAQQHSHSMQNYASQPITSTDSQTSDMIIAASRIMMSAFAR